MNYALGVRVVVSQARHILRILRNARACLAHETKGLVESVWVWLTDPSPHVLQHVMRSSADM